MWPTLIIAAVLAALVSLGFYRSSTPPVPDYLTPSAVLILLIPAWLGAMSLATRSAYYGKIILVYAVLVLPVPLGLLYLELASGDAFDWSTATPAAALLTAAIGGSRMRSTAYAVGAPRRMFVVTTLGLASLFAAVGVTSFTIREVQFHQWYSRQVPVSEPALHAEGAVTVSVFTDYQCPSCRVSFERYHHVLESVSARFPGLITIKQFDFPLDPECNPTVGEAVHPLACELAVAVRASPFHVRDTLIRRLYNAQNEIALGGTDGLRKTTATLGLPELSATDYDRYLNEIGSDVALASRVGVMRTPAYFVNGISANGWSAVELEHVVLRFLAETIR